MNLIYSYSASEKKLIGCKNILISTEVDEEELSEDDELKAAREDGKVGAKKLRKMEEKAARKAQREVCAIILIINLMLNLGMLPEI